MGRFFRLEPAGPPRNRKFASGREPRRSPARASLTYTEDMQLRTARLCLDCEEVHENQECPICLSEAGVYLTRWIPPEERRARRLPAAVKVTPGARPPARWVKRGAFGRA